MVKVFMLGNLSEIEAKFTCRKCLRSESDLLVRGWSVLCSTSRDGGTLISAPYNRRCLARGIQELIASDGQLLEEPQ